MKRIRTLCAALSALLAFSLAYGWRQNSLAEEYKRQVNAGYRKALYETAELVESMRIDLSKLKAIRTGAQRRRLLSELALYAQGAQADMASLPETLSFSEGAVKFFNQIADYSVHSLDDGSQDEGTINVLLDACEGLSEEISQARAALEAGDTLFEGVPRAQSESAGVTARYPSLLYDGPFSDGRAEGELRLSGPEMTEEEARDRAVQFVGLERVKSARCTGESHLHAPCYEFELETEDGNLSLALTKQGGWPVYMLTDKKPGARTYSVGECVDFASRFLRQRGYGDMRVSYWRMDGAMITVNFAAAQDNVILYPDLIKVDVSMETGAVVGLEASGYLANHRARDLPAPAFTPEEAKQMADSRLTLGTTRLCVIPRDGEGEAYCYEIGAWQGEDKYLIYINAMTGEEEEVLRIMEDQNGEVAA